MRRLRVDCFLIVPILVALHGVAAAGVDETYNRPGPNIWSTDFYARMIGRNAFGKSVALVVGVGNYDRFPKLSAPTSDAMRVRDFLRDEAGFDQIITLTDEKATYSRIAELMETVIPDAVGQNDRFLFYFSGHGVTRNLALTKRGYLVLKNSVRGSWQDMIDMERMKQWTENVAQARHSLFLLDACFSGLAAFEVKAGDVREKTIARLMQPGHHIVTAGTEGEETFIYKEQSLFTQAFLSAARGDGMSPQDGIVSLNEMMSRVNRILDAKQAEVGDRIRMTPRHYHARISNNAGEFFFLPQRGSYPTVAIAPPSGPLEPPVPKGPDQYLPDPSPERRFVIRKGSEATGTPLRGSSTVPTVEACERVCTQTARCNAFSFTSVTGACYAYERAELVPNIFFESGFRDASSVAENRTAAAITGSGTGPILQGGLSDPTSERRFMTRKSTEAIGTPLRESSTVPTLEACERICTQTARCNAFSFTSATGACYAYERADLVPNIFFESGFHDASAVAETSGRQSLSVPRSRIFVARRGSEATGKQLGEGTFAASVSDCEAICARQDDCRAYTYGRDSRTCYAYSEGTLVPNPYFESGLRQ